MRLWCLSLAFVLITGCMHSGIPATSVTDNWAFNNCTSIRAVSKNSCTEFRNCTSIASSSMGMCRCEHSDGSVYQGVLSDGEAWCGVWQNGSDTLVYRDGSATVEKSGVDWASTAILVAGVAVAAAMIDDDDGGSSNRNQKSTQRKNESSTELGERLLKEQRERGVSGTGRTARATTSTYPSSTTPSNSHSPRIGNDLYTVEKSSAQSCFYKSGYNKIVVSKPSFTTCPANVQAPAKNSTAVFDYSQMQTANVTGFKRAESRRYCTYTTSHGDILVPKGENAYCPQSMDF
jgi:hypothetical protein